VTGALIASRRIHFELSGWDSNGNGDTSYSLQFQGNQHKKLRVGQQATAAIINVND
jgi:hypothetical protein